MFLTEYEEKLIQEYIVRKNEDLIKYLEEVKLSRKKENYLTLIVNFC